ncbi:type II toxin-antitoxin system RelE/ParE family toxin [Asticcacaulis sp. AND118]|uniref:type II toxin-antitoxin system RelE/ParE family toxin n=1 Tax=Asticcacaulis sp. AND118 TaxID=2840468 RepID=UPI001CFF66D9|nr:type II toxin-antitoxin system RelE/ParE family toxin [Asticcacaulis sp. AND118]UDF05226.1 type II toxin-antitoxin system RelE/ParE family toxin [Asticcacaulis sp. AND118]
MHTVCELNSFRRSAEKAGLTAEEINDFIDMISCDPTAGDVIEGTGGCRKIRIAIGANNKGKSGGARVVTFFTGLNMPIFLVAVFAKSERINLSKANRNALKGMTEQIVEAYAKRVSPLKVEATA